MVITLRSLPYDAVGWLPLVRVSAPMKYPSLNDMCAAKGLSARSNLSSYFAGLKNSMVASYSHVPGIITLYVTFGYTFFATLISLLTLFKSSLPFFLFLFMFDFLVKSVPQILCFVKCLQCSLSPFKRYRLDIVIGFVSVFLDVVEKGCAMCWKYFLSVNEYSSKFRRDKLMAPFFRADALFFKKRNHQMIQRVITAGHAGITTFIMKKNAGILHEVFCFFQPHGLHDWNYNMNK